MDTRLFVPYVDVRDTEVDYVKLVTPWGNIKLNKGFIMQLAFSVMVIVVTVMLWRCSIRLNATLKQKIATKERLDEDKEEEEEEEIEEEEEEEESMGIPDEKMVEQGENRYFYTHQHQDAIDGKKRVTVSSYGWSDSKKMVSIYLTDNAVRNMKDEQLKVNWTNMSLSMDLFNTSGSGDLAKSLVISNLFQEIIGKWKITLSTMMPFMSKIKNGNQVASFVCVQNRTIEQIY
ncbi:unnamed protein product [Peronospora belbahrii]|uniref:Uncharacterized protein n=1 Tax=Peronospora belbahrii TaxID=622444 RepID=A0ABN8D6K3_9STRA|nr:unnamed protein product [Peronospora belbahrii]